METISYSSMQSDNIGMLVFSLHNLHERRYVRKYTYFSLSKYTLCSLPCRFATCNGEICCRFAGCTQIDLFCEKKQTVEVYSYKVETFSHGRMPV